VNTTGRPKPVNQEIWPTDLVSLFHTQTADLPARARRRRRVMSRRRSTKPVRLSPALARLIEAAGRHSEEAESSDFKSAARALREFGSLAWWVVPIYGVFVPNDDEVSIVVERVAARHLGLEQARAEYCERQGFNVLARFREEGESAKTADRTELQKLLQYSRLLRGRRERGEGERHCSTGPGTAARRKWSTRQ
jgi:hypothetical protein